MLQIVPFPVAERDTAPSPKYSTIAPVPPFTVRIPATFRITSFADGNVVGIVTSGTQSPSMGIAIGMGYVPTALATPDSEIYIRIRNKDIKAKVVKMPFYKK
jgi:glycine cleavage system aminomethyltransferase T